MNKKWQTGIAIFFLVLAFIITGNLAYDSGYDLGLKDGKVIGEIEGKVQAELLNPPMPKISWYEESKEPNFEDVLANIFEEIDTANITIHIEDTEGKKADIHISWSK